MLSTIQGRLWRRVACFCLIICVGLSDEVPTAVRELYATSHDQEASLSGLLGSCLGAVSIDSDPSLPAVKRYYFGNCEDDSIKIVLDGGVHPREIIGGSVALKVIENLCQSTAVEWATARSKSCIIVVPILNPCAFDQVLVHGDTCRRRSCDTITGATRTENSVDLDRNFPVRWFEGDSDPSSERFRGVHPVASPEAMFLTSLVVFERPDVYISLRSGAKGLAFARSSDETSQHLLEELRKIVCENCDIGSDKKITGEDSPGSFTEYAHALGVRHAFSFYVYTQKSEKCFQRYNPVDAATYKDVLERWSKGVGAALKLISEQVIGSPLDLKGLFQKDPASSIATSSPLREHICFPTYEEDCSENTCKVKEQLG